MGSDGSANHECGTRDPVLLRLEMWEVVAVPTINIILRSCFAQGRQI